MKKVELYGLVLAGGRSTRMRHDKGLINYHGKPQREFLFDLLNRYCDQVFTSCRKQQSISSSLHPIPDTFNFEGPLNGIMSAFELYPNFAWLAVAVDMPFINQEVLQLLLLNRDESKVATCFSDSEGKLPEPLLTIWEPSAFPLLKLFVEAGGISPREFLIANNCNKLMHTNSKIHININTPEDFHKLKY